jgi:hypothetical protein
MGLTPPASTLKAPNFTLFFIYLEGWSGNKSTIIAAFTGLFSVEQISGWNDWQEKSKYWEETCSGAALFTTDPT